MCTGGNSISASGGGGATAKALNGGGKASMWSMGLQGLSTGMQMNAISNQADYSASAAIANANILDQQSASAGQQGAWQANKLRQQGRQVAGAQTAAFSANGLDVQAGSPLSVLAGTSQMAEEDAQTATYNANLKMWGLQNQANAYRTQAKYIQQSASSNKMASLLTGVTKVAAQYYGMGG